MSSLSVWIVLGVLGFPPPSFIPVPRFMPCPNFEPAVMPPVEFLETDRRLWQASQYQTVELFEFPAETGGCKGGSCRFRFQFPFRRR